MVRAQGLSYAIRALTQKTPLLRHNAAMNQDPKNQATPDADTTHFGFRDVPVAGVSPGWASVLV